jgi:hypothetical protein
MSLCDTCRQPGSCCSGFVLSDPKGEVTHWDCATRDEINADILARSGWPFKATAIRSRWTDAATGQPYNTWYFGCPLLGGDGRCTVYETRPQLCRDYAAGSSPLCVEHQPGVTVPLEFCGIPIVEDVACA